MTEEEANIPLGNSGAKFTKQQFLTYGRMAQEYLYRRGEADQKDTRPNVSKAARKRAAELQALYDKPSVEDIPYSPKEPTPTEEILDRANVEIAAGTTINAAKIAETRIRLEDVRQTARKRGQTARRRSG